MPRNISFQKLNLIVAGDIAEKHVKITTVGKGVLTTMSKLKISKDEEDVDKKFVHKFPPEILTGGHMVLAAAKRMNKITKGMEFSYYLLNSTEHKLIKTVRIYSIDTQAVKKFAALIKVDLKIAEERMVSFLCFLQGYLTERRVLLPNIMP